MSAPQPPPRCHPPAGGQWLTSRGARCRVTQLLDRLDRVVQEGNLFDPERPSLGSELEALRQHLEALSSGPDIWDGHSDRPAGVSPEGWAVPVCVCAVGSPAPCCGFEPQLGGVLPEPGLCLRPPI